MIEITCHSCEKSFRVRPEFAGRSTRCPSCGASLQINKSSPTTEAPPEMPRSKVAPVSSGMSYDTRPDRSKEWKKFAGALSREQVAILFFGAALLFGLFAGVCTAAEVFRGPDMEIVGWVFLAMVVVPLLIAFAFHCLSRLLATNVPSGYWAKPVAFLGLLGSMGIPGFSILMIVTSAALNDRYLEQLVVYVGVVGLLFSVVASMGSIFLLTSQMGTAIGSKEISKSFGKFGVTVGITLVLLVGLMIVLAILVSVFEGGPRRGYANGYGYTYRRDPFEVLGRLFLLFPLPILVAVFLIAYHRLLGVCRKTLLARAKGVYDDK